MKKKTSFIFITFLISTIIIGKSTDKIQDYLPVPPPYSQYTYNVTFVIDEISFSHKYFYRVKYLKYGKIKSDNIIEVKYEQYFSDSNTIGENSLYLNIKDGYLYWDESSLNQDNKIHILKEPLDIGQTWKDDNYVYKIDSRYISTFNNEKRECLEVSMEKESGTVSYQVHFCKNLGLFKFKEIYKGGYEEYVLAEVEK